MAGLAIGINLFATPGSAAVYKPANTLKPLETIERRVGTALQHIPVDDTRDTNDITGSSTKLVDLDVLGSSWEQYQAGLADVLNSFRQPDDRIEPDRHNAKQMHLVDVAACLLRALLNDLRHTRAITVGSVVHVVPAYASAILRRMLHDSTRIAGLSADKIHFITEPAAFVLAYMNRTVVTQGSTCLVVTGNCEEYYASVVEVDRQLQGIAVHATVQGKSDPGDAMLAIGVAHCAALALRQAKTTPATIIIVSQAFEHQTQVCDRLSLLCPNAGQADTDLDANGLAAVRGAAISAARSDSGATNADSRSEYLDDRNPVALVRRRVGSNEVFPLIEVGADEDSSYGGFMVSSDAAGGAKIEIELLEKAASGDYEALVAIIEIVPDSRNRQASDYQLSIERDTAGMVMLDVYRDPASNIDELTATPLGLTDEEIQRSKSSLSA
ncbi:hypothetical protein LTR17_019189 [Elasticomyces elasticus]|nr:hypothetical protein LTR17_019189 [Elasticomyces elasticus]